MQHGYQSDLVPECCHQILKAREVVSSMSSHYFYKEYEQKSTA
jgi:hypothetical protein